MPQAVVEMQVGQQQRYKELAERLRDAGRKDLQRKLTKAIKQEGDAALAAVKAGWLGVDVSSSRGGTAAPVRSTGLRARAAAATTIKVLGTGIRITTVGSKVDPVYGRSLTKGLDGLGRWRHPVMGNREVWTTQKGQEVFYSNVHRFESRWRAGIERVMGDIAAQIEG